MRRDHPMAAPAAARADAGCARGRPSCGPRAPATGALSAVLGSSGARAGIALALLLALATPGCMYTFNQGGGFPAHIRTLYIESFENETVEFGVGQLIDQEIMLRVPRALGVQLAGRDAADAVLTGKITQYANQTQSQRARDSGTFEIEQQQVNIGVNVRIVDVERNVILWEGQVTGQALYRPDTQSEDDARVVAVEQVIQRIIDGAQSQW